MHGARPEDAVPPERHGTVGKDSTRRKLWYKSEIRRYMSETLTPCQNDVNTLQIASYGYSRKRISVRQPLNQVPPLVTRQGTEMAAPYPLEG